MGHMSHEEKAELMSTSTARKSLVRATEDGERRWFLGDGLHIWRATADDTGGAFLLFEDRMDRGKVTPLYMGRVQASATKNSGIEILGPPPFSQIAQG